MGSKIRLLAIAALASSVFAVSANAGTMSWVMNNNTNAEIELEFFSMARNHMWPGGDEIYPISPRDGQLSYKLSCNNGEQICYGAWLVKDDTTYWGVGPGNQQECQDCCAICGEENHEPVDLVY